MNRVARFVSGLLAWRHKRFVANGNRCRARRIEQFVKLIGDENEMVLDVGYGYGQFERRLVDLGVRNDVIALDIVARGSSEHPNVLVFVQADAAHLPLADASIALVYCNSLLEHVGDWRVQRQVLAEIERVGRKLFVQTPNRHFPIEPHHLVPTFQYWPRFLQRWIGEAVLGHYEEVWLLDRKAVEALAGNGERITVREEKLCGLTKSFVLVRGLQTTQGDCPQKAPDHTVSLLGVGVDRVSLPDLLEGVQALAGTPGQRCVMYANVHVLNMAYHDPDLRDILNRADLVYCDGAGVVLGARLLGRRLPSRMTGADWIDPLCRSCLENGTTLYFLGGRPGVGTRAARTLRERYPGVEIVGVHHGYIDETDICDEAVADINAAGPDILLVGMGTPTQEKWIAAHRDQLEVPVVWVVGALFDFVAGVQPRGPRWMLDNGLEWLYRLYSDPGRLWRRYLVGNPLFLLRVLKQRLTNLDHSPRNPSL